MASGSIFWTFSSSKSMNAYFISICAHYHKREDPVDPRKDRTALRNIAFELNFKNGNCQVSQMCLIGEWILSIEDPL